MTGGGDAPGLNGIIEATVRTLATYGWEVIGIEDGFEGIFEERHRKLSGKELEGFHAEAGTLLGTSNKSRVAGREKEFVEKYKRLGVEGLIACGGDGTFEGLSRVAADVHMVGVPKTIDNDLAGTEITFGYDTACAVVAESVDALRATANSHRRVMIVETMGRTAGWIALGGGLASYADAILLPERPFSRSELKKFIQQKQATGKRYLIFVASEGAMAKNENASVAFTVENSPQKERFGGFSTQLARWIEQETGWESRNVVLGHLQRSRHPTTTDRFLTLSMGIEAARMVHENQWNQGIVYRQGRVQRAPIQDLMQPPKLVPPDHRWVKLAQELGIFI